MSSSSASAQASIIVRPSLGDRVLHLGGDVGDVELRAEVVLVDASLVGDQVDDALELVLGADRELNRDRVGAEPLADRPHRHVEVGADPVHLVDEGDPRDRVLVGLAPDGLRLGLDPGDRVEDGDRAVEDAQRALDLDREVDVARGVDDVDPVTVPLAGVAAEVIVIPRSCSCSIQSMTAAPSWTSPILWVRPV